MAGEQARHQRALVQRFLFVVAALFVGVCMIGVFTFTLLAGYPDWARTHL